MVIHNFSGYTPYNKTPFYSYYKILAMLPWASQVVLVVKNPPAMQEM